MIETAATSCQALPLHEHLVLALSQNRHRGSFRGFGLAPIEASSWLRPRVPRIQHSAGMGARRSTVSVRQVSQLSLLGMGRRPLRQGFSLLIADVDTESGLSSGLWARG